MHRNNNVPHGIQRGIREPQEYSTQQPRLSLLGWQEIRLTKPCACGYSYSWAVPRPDTRHHAALHCQSCEAQIAAELTKIPAHWSLNPAHPCRVNLSAFVKFANCQAISSRIGGNF